MGVSKNARKMSRFLCIVVGLVCSATLLYADVTGIILGTVNDASGAIIPNASVTLRNPYTGLVRSTRTDATGSFQFPLVPIGDGFVVEVTVPHFQTFYQSEIKLLVNQSYFLDIHLAPGAETQTVKVSAAPVQVETSSTQLGDVIQDKEMTALPLNGRSYVDLLSLQAGVAPVNTGLEGAASISVSGNLDGGTLAVNGSRETSNAFLVNGGDVEEPAANGTSVIPTLDSIQEFRVLTAAFDAEYGRLAGSQINVVTKSGTDAFHGNLYEFLRNDDFDAHNYFDAPGSPIGELRQNQFGGTFGGPILKNRLFFFSDYQGTRQISGASTGTIIVPSTLERSGNFSAVNSSGNFALTGIVHGCEASNDNGHCMNDVLTQRLGYPVTNGEPYWLPGCDTQNGTCVFPGGIIPESAWSPAAAGTLQFIPAPTGSLGGTPFFSTNAYKGTVRDDKFGQRIDYNRPNSVWSIYYHFDDAAVLAPFYASNVPGFGGLTPSRSQQVNLSNTHIFGASAFNEWRLNATRFADNAGKPAIAAEPVSKYGFVAGGLGITPSAPALSGVPFVTLGQSVNVSFGIIGPGPQYDNVFQAEDNFSKIVGKHSLKFGVSGRYFAIISGAYVIPDGDYGFYGTETGNDFADYLLGAPASFSDYSGAELAPRSKYLGVYGQDSFKVRPGLTLNYGLRWEFSNPWSDTRGRLTAWDPGLQSTRFPNSPRGWVFPGDPGIPNSLAPTRYDKFAPRFGAAYSPRFTDGVAAKLFGGPNKSSIRASYGIFYTAYEQVINSAQLGDAPFGLFWVSPSQIYFEEPFKGRQGSDPGQRFPYPPSGGINDSLSTWSLLQPITDNVGFQVNASVPYVEDLDFSLQRQLSQSTILTVAYVGTHGHHLLSRIDPNPGNQALCLQVRQALGPASGCGPNGEDTIYTLPSGQPVYGTRPYSVTSGRLLNNNPPELDFTFMALVNTEANSHYNALEITVDKRAGALQMRGAYTWSKSLDNASASFTAGNPYNTKLQSLSGFDLTHDFVASYSYDMPLTHSSSGLVYDLLGGWQISGITRFATGLPVPLAQSGDLALCGDGCGTPNYNGQRLNYYNPRKSANHQYVSTSQFYSEVLGSIGNAGREFFHGPGFNQTDVALHKITRVTEGTSIEFRAEFFNVFNHAQFLNPVGDFASGAFGQVQAARDPRIGQLALKFAF